MPGKEENSYSRFEFTTASWTKKGNAVRDFEKQFPAVTIEQWYETAEMFVAKFNEEDIDARVMYDKKGSWLSTVLQYGEKQMPQNIRRMVKSQYFDERIKLVEEVSTTAGKAWVIHMEDDKKIMWIRASAYNMEVMKEIGKS
jgi:hypothetical protein